MDIVFIVLTALLYALTRWVVGAIARLGGIE